MRLIALAVVCVFVVIVMLALSPAPAPVVAGDPTLDAALYAIAQATARAAETRQAGEATRQAAQAEEARARAAAQATLVAESLQQTRTAAQATATAQSAAATATQEALNLRATAEQHERDISAQASATFAAMSAQATATVAAISAQATRQAIERQARDEQRAQSFAWWLSALKVMGIGVMLAGAAAVLCVVIWRIHRAGRIQRDAACDAPPAEDEIPHIPQPDVVYSPQAAEVIGNALGVQYE